MYSIINIGSFSRTGTSDVCPSWGGPQLTLLSRDPTNQSSSTLFATKVAYPVRLLPLPRSAVILQGILRTPKLISFAHLEIPWRYLLIKVYADSQMTNSNKQGRSMWDIAEEPDSRQTQARNTAILAIAASTMRQLDETHLNSCVGLH